MAKLLTKEPEVILKNGKPTAVILDIKKFQEILERLEDMEDLAELEKIRKAPMKFRKFEEVLKECPHV